MSEPYGFGDTTPSSPSDENKKPDNADGDLEAGADTDGSGEPGKKGKLNAQERINQLVGKIHDLEGQLQSMRVPVPTPDVPNPAAQKAIEQLKSLKFVDQNLLEERITQLQDRIVLDSEHQRLASELNGSDGRPKYDKAKVEVFMREKGIYLPEAAYEYMYRKELRDWYAKNTTNRPSSHLEAPGKPGAQQQGGDVITRETIRQKMGTAEWRTYYDQHRDTILTLMQKGQL
jgi:hypothetical protein